jgi:ABC-type multidrug transport system permease subunit
VVAGRGVADLLNAAVGLAVLLACGWVIGWESNDGVARALAAFGLLLWLRFAMIWLGLWLGLVAGRPEAVVAAQILVWPVGFLSNAFSDPDTMPSWLGAIAEWNPLSATAAATRELFGNPGWGGDSWAATHAVELALAWPLVLTLVFFPLAVARYRSLGE